MKQKEECSMTEKNTARQQHPIPPFYKADSRILILGSFPSVQSRRQRFFYGHPQNRFWMVVSAVFGCDLPHTLEEKKFFLESNRIALWDVISSCEIEGSSDSSIKNAEPNDLRMILDSCDIRKIYINGKTAERLYIKYLLPQTGREAVCLPSTSPANAAWTLPRLIGAWSAIREE